MANIHPGTSHHDDEVDIKELLKKTIKTLERGTKIILIAVLMGGIVGIAYALRISKTYDSSMVLRSDILALANIKSLIDPLKILIDEGNTAALKEKIRLEEEIVSSLRVIEVESVFEKEGDNKESASYFEIFITVTDNTVLPNLQDGIITYLNANDFVKKRVALKEKRLKTLIEKIDIEIREIDSLKRRVEAGTILTSGGSNVVLMEPTNIYQQAVLLEEKKQEYIEELALVESIQVVKEFTPFNKPSNPSWILSVVVGLVGGLIVGFAILFFKELDRYIKS